MEIQLVSLNCLLKSGSIVTAHYDKYLLKSLGGRRDCTRGDRNVILIVVMILQVYVYVKTHRIVNFEYLQFIGYQLYLNIAVKKVS